MVRHLYRFYLYTVFIALLIFAAVAVGQFLATVLAFTPLRGSNDVVPDHTVVLQSTIFVLVSLLIAGALGGLHYWLIRRDMRNDPAAEASAIRSFFLNISEAIGVALVVPFVGFMMLAERVYSPNADIVSPTAFALPTLALVLLLEAERQRTHTLSRGTLIFRRLHVYAMQVILLIYLTFAWLSDIGAFVGSNIPLLIGSLLWFVAWFVGYGLLARKDTATLLRLILHGAGLAYGIGWLLSGLQQGVTLLLFFPFNIPVALHDVFGPYPSHDFVSPLTLGILVTALYAWWLHLAARQHLIKRTTLTFTEYAIAGVLAAAACWWGCGNVLYTLLQHLTPIPSALDARLWASSIAFTLVGMGYIGFDLSLRRHNRLEPGTAAGPRRGFVFALLGGGILSLAIGGATALYAWGTALLGAPLHNWQQVAHGGLAACIVGGFLTGIYLWTGAREALFNDLGKRPAPQITPASPTERPPTSALGIETILDELLANKLTRDEAAARIRALGNVSGSTLVRTATPSEDTQNASGPRQARV
jgi:hypothetical protein